MRNILTRTIIETIVRRSIEDIKDSPERGIRNLVDMALQFSEGKFQKYFFSIAQTMLENEKNAYYGLLRNMSSYIDTDHLVKFGMNVGYNSCTVGAKRIRDRQARENRHIPWTVKLEMDPSNYQEKREFYEYAIEEGKRMGIYTWQIQMTGNPQCVLSLVEKYPECAFVIYCRPGDLSEEFLDSASACLNLMLAVEYEGAGDWIWRELRKRGMFYSAYVIYTPENAEKVLSGDLFYDIQQCCPAFAGLISRRDCSRELRERIYARVRELRERACLRLFPWEMVYDSCFIDGIISGKECAVGFDRDGDLHMSYEQEARKGCNLFENHLDDIFRQLFAKLQPGTISTLGSAV